MSVFDVSQVAAEDIGEGFGVEIGSGLRDRLDVFSRWADVSAEDDVEVILSAWASGRVGATATERSEGGSERSESRFGSLVWVDDVPVLR